MHLAANLDLLSVGIAIAGIALLGVLVLFNNRRSATHRAFFYFALVSVCWSVANYTSYQLPASMTALYALRAVMFFAVWHAFTFFNLAFAFPHTHVRRPLWYVWILLPLVAVVSIFTLTPYVFQRISAVALNGSIAGVQNGPGIAGFGITVLLLIGAGIIILSWKARHARKEQRASYSLLLYGVVLTFLLLIGFNFYIPAVYNDPHFIPLGALFLLPFVIFSAVSILRYGLFRIRVAAIGLLGFYLSAAVFVNVIFAQNVAALVFTGSELVLVLIISFWLIRSVLKEVRQRELIEHQARQLEETNARQEALIHFISHEVKGYLTKAMGGFAALAEGDFGQLPPDAKALAEEALIQTRAGSHSVMDILQAANLKRGTVSYRMTPFDFGELTKQSFKRFAQMAADKGLTYTLSIDEKAGPYTVSGDKNQLAEHVVRNLMENAVNYTLRGSVLVTLSRQGGAVVLAVTDTGIGITDEDKQRLFTEGGHGKDSIKVNAHSTGYGLYIAKQIVDAHHGTIRAESEGPDQGSTFTLELPAA